jgi:chemotaxis protein methyltransferase CheR
MTGAFDHLGLGLSQSSLALVRDLVHERTGLFYDNGRYDMLADRLGPLVTNRGFDSFLDYYYFLKYDAASSLEWDRVFDALVVPETYFWREIDQLKAVVEVIVPRLVREHQRPLRIWSVPCASGEEPLTIAMLLDRAGWFERARIELVASDASAAALEAARTGVYRERAFRTLPPELKQRYFTPAGERWRVDPALHARVSRWGQVNLMALDEVRAWAHADVIFCRNVFIYFSEPGIRRVVDVFADQMPAPAYLCVGAAESLLRITDRFELEEINGAFVYAKRVRRTEGQ